MYNHLEGCHILSYNIVVMFSNNTGYRALLRSFFNMNVESIDADLKENYYDEETHDELLFDQAAVDRGMTDILNKTAGNPLFDELYSLAAAKMFSTDRETGLCILLSYDFFHDFYVLWQMFSNEPNDVSDTTECYVILLNRLSIKK